MMRNCPICNEPATHSFNTEFATVYKCSHANCGHLFAVDTTPFVGVHELANDEKKDYSIYKERNHFLVRYLKKRRFLKLNYDILDFGAGTGHFLGYIRKHMEGLNVTAIEYNEQYHEHLSTIAEDVYKTMDQIPSETKFNSILFIEVLEHLDDPMEVLFELRNRLKDGGMLFLTTPAGDLKRSVANPGELYAYDTDAHVQFFTESSLRLALNKAGFNKVNYRYINELYPDREYQGYKAVLNTLKGYYAHWRGYTGHLTYFAS